MIPFSFLLPLLSNWQRYAIYTLVALTVGMGIWGHGYFKGKQALYEYQAEQAREAVRIIKQVEVLKETVRVPYIKREVQIVERFVEIERESKVPVRAGCNTTLGWMRSHDYAADPDQRPEGALDDAGDSTVDEARTLAVIRGNYKLYHETVNDLKACRAFVNGLPEATQ